MLRKLRAGILGYGRMGREFVAAMLESDLWEVAAVYDICGKARRLAEQQVPSAAIYPLGGYEVNGSHYYYNITRFVTVKIMPNGNGGVVIQPTGYVDPAAVFDTHTATPAGTDSGSTIQTTLMAPKLSQ